MQISSYRYRGNVSIGLVQNDTLFDIGRLFGCFEMKEFLATHIGDIAHRVTSGLPALSIEEVEFLPVVPHPEKIIAIGLNYLTHVAETGRKEAAYPTIFTRFADSQVGHLQPMIKPDISDKFDFEGELAVIIGKRGRKINARDALSHVAGYSIYNDGSIRDWQSHTSQFTPGKNFPRTGAFGPWLVTPDEIVDPSALQVTTRLNGEVVQSSCTDKMIFPVPRLIEYISQFCALSPGDVIITGTPGGVGAQRTPPLFMKVGDQVEVEVSGIGVLKNEIAKEDR